MKKITIIVSICMMLSGCGYINSWFHDNPIPIPTPDPVVTVTAKDEIDPATVKVYSAKSSVFTDYPITLTITKMERGNLFRWEYDKPCTWQESNGNIGNNWCFLKRDGQWICEPSDWLRKGQNYKGPGDIKVCIGSNPDGTPIVLRPASGEQYGYMTSTQARKGINGNGKERSQIKLGIWP